MLWFDSQGDIEAHCSTSLLHALVSSASDLKVIQQFANFFAQEKPDGETGSDFSLSAEIQFETWLAKRNRTD